MAELNPYEPAAARPRDRSRWLVLTWALLAVAIGATTMTIAGRATSPADVLAEIQAFVAQHPTARYEGSTTHVPGDDSVGTRRRGELVLPGRRHEVNTVDGDTFESIVVGDDRFTRESGEGRPAGQWRRLPRWNDISTTASGDGFWADSAPPLPGGPPDEVLRSLARMGHLEERGGRLVATYRNRDVLSADVRQALTGGPDEDLTSLFGGYLDAVVTVTVEHGDDGRLDAIAVETPDTSNHWTRTETRYRDWGGAITVEAPPASEIDPTPDVDEAELAAFVPGPVLAPTNLPSGWTLVGGRTLAHDDENEDCAAAILDYGPAVDDFTASVTLVEPDCPSFERYQPDLMSGRRARFGDHDVVIHDDIDHFFPYPELEYGVGASLRVPQGWVLVATSEGEDVLARLVASLAPYRP